MALGGSDQNAEYALSKLLQMGTVAEYKSEFVILTNRVTGISANLLKSFYISGLKLELQRELFRSRPTTLGEAFSFARIAEARFEDERSTIAIAKPNKLTAHVHVQDLEQTTRGRGDEPNRILLVMIHHMIYPITVEVLNQIFSPHGYGCNIYEGCCQLDIHFSNLKELQENQEEHICYYYWENCFSILNVKEAGNTKSPLSADTFGNSGVDESEASGPKTPAKEVVDNANGSALIFLVGYDTGSEVVTGLPEEFQEGDMVDALSRVLEQKSLEKGLIAVAEDETTHFLEPHYSPSSILVPVILLVEEYRIPESISLQDNTLRARSRPTTLREAFFFARITEARFEDERSTIAIAKPNKLTAHVHVQDLSKLLEEEGTSLIGCNIYEVCCQLDIQFSNLKELQENQEEHICYYYWENCFSILNVKEAGNTKSPLSADTFGNSGVDESETSGPETPTKEVVDNANGSALIFLVGYDTGSKVVTGLPEEFQEGDMVDALSRVLEQKSLEKRLIAVAEDETTHFLEPHYSPSSILVLVILLVEEYDNTLRARWL
ncbi:hypothetical protein Tco_0640112 [Tanacetum coccineum]